MRSDGNEGVRTMVRTPSLSSLLLLKTKQKKPPTQKNFFIIFWFWI